MPNRFKLTEGEVEAMIPNYKMVKSGDIFKNYVDFSRFIGYNMPQKGKGRGLFVEKLNRIFEIEKIVGSHSFKIVRLKDIDEISSEYAEKRVQAYKDYDGFNVGFEDWYKRGIYKIENDTEVYIGSTTDAFRHRFQGHISSPFPTREFILERDGIFEILEIFENQEISQRDAEVIEKSYIEKYIDESNLTVLNRYFNNNYNCSRSDVIEIVSDLMPSDIIDELTNELLEVVSKSKYENYIKSFCVNKDDKLTNL